MENGTQEKILKILLKDFTIKPTITSLAQETGLSRVGMWKVLKKMQYEKIIMLSPVGSGKTSTYSVSLNWDNSLVEKRTALALTEDALKKQRWLANFRELEKKVDFLVIYGSIIHSPGEASDVDILSVVQNKKRFLEIEGAVQRIQKTQLKKIHAVNFTQAEFKEELEKPNKVFIDALKKGVVLFGQERFVKIVRGMRRK